MKYYAYLLYLIYRNMYQKPPCMKAKKKSFPKIKKKLSGFLSDESWKITKENAIGASVWAMLFAWFEQAVAAHTNTFSPDIVDNKTFNIWGSVVCQHVSGVVNGHLSSTPTGNITGWQSVTHASHNSSWTWSGSGSGTWSWTGSGCGSGGCWCGSGCGSGY